MILPQTYAASLFILLIAFFCLGSWANTCKMGMRGSRKAMGAKLRYELYYVDWIIGAFACVVILALTVGSLGFDGFSLRDDLLIAARKAWLFAFAAGAIFSLGNILMLASMSLAGLAIAFATAFGIAQCVAAPIGYFIKHDRPVSFLILGCCLALAAVGIAGWLHRCQVEMRHEEAARAGKAKSTRRPPSAKPIILAAAGGLLIGGAAPLSDRAQAGEIGLGPYSLSFLFTFGAAAAGVLWTLFLMNLPVEGEPIEIPDYVRGPWKKHFYGLAGGAIWSIGLVASLVPVASVLARGVSTGLPLTAAVTGSAAVLAAVWGIAVWKELRGADIRMTVLSALMLLLLEGAIVVLALGPIYAAS
jgi:glucose uptake protein